MNKSTIIATCLVNSGMTHSSEEAENAVKKIFMDEFPNSDFAQWNRGVDESVAANIIKNVGRASRINVRKFIEDLWE